MSDHFSVLFVGGTGAISSSCVKEAVAQGMDVAVLNRGRSSLVHVGRHATCAYQSTSWKSTIE